MPLLFAVTLFVSASLLFMVQPMVGKMVLPLLGGSPAVWNACMVFFQALLLLGYLYAHKLASIESPRKQAAIHLLVLALPLAVFALAAAFGARHTPIAIVEALAPTDEKSPIISVLLILTVAIGIPFFVVSTTATLLQKWFVYTGHPSARDPYFLYSASNVGSLLSLLGYPLIIEPRLSIDGQAWVFAIGFGILAVMIAYCGRAANNPIGVPPASAQPGGKKAAKAEATQLASTAHVPAPPPEPPPTLMRKLKWIALAFVPSTLMLGVTFHMTTDIASVPLLWVGPLALYLITFIIAFGRVPDWFRVVIGNLAPVMILLLVFVLISGVNPGIGVTLLLHMLTFFAAALMCHYELARDRPSPKYLTEFFLLMSVGGMLGGVFNSLLAPLVFPYAYEYPLALIIACLMVPKLTEGEEEPAEPAEPARSDDAPRPLAERVVEWLPLAGVILNTAVLAFGLLWLFLRSPQPIVLGEGMEVAPMTLLYAVAGMFLAGVVSVVAVELSGRSGGGKPGRACEVWDRTPPGARGVLLAAVNPLALPWALAGVVRTRERLRLYLDLVIPVVVGIGFYLLAYLAVQPRFESAAKGVSTRINLSEETVRVIFLYAVPVMICFFFVDRPLRFALAVAAILGPVTYREYSSDAVHSERSFFGILKIQEVGAVVPLRKGDTVLQHPDGRPMIASRYTFRKLVHGTTLHGTQFAEHDRHILDDFQMIMPGLTPWDAVAVAGAIHAYDIRQEPLTYYHRSGPVGAMFSELRRRKNGAEEKAHFAMVGLGTGSASCYALPGQKITFYEIDPAVRNLVADTDKYFNFVESARQRGAKLDIQMGDARLVLKKDEDRKYTLLLVDAFSSDSIPVHLLTVEAVQLYLDRMTDDGMLALHISNKFVKLEPVVAAIANKLGLTARVWNDDAEGRAGKTASSWVVLARKPEHLGELYSPIGDLPFAREPEANGDDTMRVAETVASPTTRYYRSLMNMPIAASLMADYDAELEVKNEKGKTRYHELNEGTGTVDGPGLKAAWLGWVDARSGMTNDPQGKKRLKELLEFIDKHGPTKALAEIDAKLDKSASLTGEEKDWLEWARASMRANQPSVAWLEWINGKLAKTTESREKARLGLYKGLINRYGPGTELGDAMHTLHGHAFRRLETFSEVPAWTDDYSDVLRVMMIPELQRVRKFFGLPTPVER